MSVTQKYHEFALFVVLAANFVALRTAGTGTCNGVASLLLYPLECGFAFMLQQRTLERSQEHPWFGDCSWIQDL